jgi:hypothetical protein
MTLLLLHWNGRFGNRMHQYCYGATYAKATADLILPSDWEGTKLFKNHYHTVLEDNRLRLDLNQTKPELDTLSYRLKALQEFSDRTNIPFCHANPDAPETFDRKYIAIDSMCCYHPSIFARFRRSQVLNYFEFSDRVKELDCYKRLSDRQGTYDVAHLRRTDIADPNNLSNNGYSVVSKNSYFKAFSRYGYDPEKIIWVTDEGQKTWKGGWNYPTGSEWNDIFGFDWLEDFLTIYFARSIFRANSSFSFWAALLSPTAENIYAPRLHTRVPRREVDFDFENSNQPHWMCLASEACPDIIID